MNTPSLELGWILVAPGHDEYPNGPWLMDRIYPEDGSNEDGIPGTVNHPEANNPAGLCLESNGGERVFVSWCVLVHGDTDLKEPKHLGAIILRYVHQHDPMAKLIWGIIEASR